MSFDNSRYIFNSFNNYSSVVMPQGRVQLDADWNEWLSEIARRIQAGTLDTMGRAVYPLTTLNAFYISGSSNPSAITIGLGRMYVDGLLAENHGALSASTPWDPALAELSGSPQPAPTSVGPTPNDTPYTSQPYLPGAALPPGTGPYLFYLDVWTRAVTWLQDSALVDKAVGVDTSGRLQTVWQVRWLNASSSASVVPGTQTPIGCGTPDSSIVYPSPSFGLLLNGTVPNSTAGPCCLSSGTGYTGVENQFYRVEIHQGGPIGKATYKWSKENASVITSVTAIQSLSNAANTMVTVLTVASLGRDQVLGFNNGNWIELTTDTIELSGMPDPNTNPYGSPGLLCQIDHVVPATNQIYLTGQINTSTYPGNQFGVTGSPAANMRIRRWDQSSTVYSTTSTGTQTPYPIADFAGDIPVPPGGLTMVLEDGITVTFSFASGGNTFNSGDYWTFAARTFDGSLDPQYPFPQPPRGIHHHYTKLSVVTFSASGNTIANTDCRKPWPLAGDGDCGCCTVTVGDGQTSFGQYNSIQQAINSLNMPEGGEVCILPGTYYENVLIQGLTQVKLSGAGPQTIWNAYSAAPSSGTYDTGGANNPANSLTTSSGMQSILTISGSSHIELTGFTMQAPDKMSCILLDPTVTPNKSSSIPVPPAGTSSSTDVTLANLVLAASTCPAITAVQAQTLTIGDNRILMQDVASDWPAIYVSGDEIAIEGNWIGLDDSADAENYAPATMAQKPDSPISSTVPATWTGNGGIQVGGFSTGVDIANNQIEGGAFNGISLGGILQLVNGIASATTLNGLFLTSPMKPNVGTTLVLPANAGNIELGADGPLQNINIQGNTITSMGLCGIGPVGFFPNATTPEVVSIGNLSIVGNTIKGSLQAVVAPLTSADSGLSYGAICLPDLQGLIIRDNIITDFGSVPGAQVCGIFLLNGEQVDISRNQITETRDWAAIPTPAASITKTRAGILIGTVSPLALNQTATTPAWTGASAQGTSEATGINAPPPLYQPGLPALTIDRNVVRVTLGPSLAVAGYGPFSITGNQFSTGGTMKGGSDSFLNVKVLNLGTPVEYDAMTTYSGLYGSLSGDSPTQVLQGVSATLQQSTNGTVLFTNNICQSELRASGETSLINVGILTFDHLNFSNNVTWMDGNSIGKPDNDLYLSALMDVFLMGVTAQVNGNRLQESLGSVFFSGISLGALNITAQNISTFCLFTAPASASINNLSGVQAAADAAAAASNGQAQQVCGGGSGEDANSLSARMKVAAKASATDPQAELTGGLAETDTYAAAQVNRLALVHQARVTQANRIATSIAARPGASSALLTAAKAAVSNAQATATRILMMKAQITSPAPTVNAKGWALYGHVYNSSGAAVDAYSVYFVDSTNTYQNAYGIAYTASDGSYRIVNSGPAAGQSAPATPQLFLQVGNAAGDPIYTSSSAFTPVTGKATYEDVTLPAGEKVLGKLPTVLRTVILPAVEEKPALTVDPPKSEG